MKQVIFKLTKKQEAYFTVEAALIMPIAFFIIIFILSLGVFLYNRLVFTQNSIILMVRGSQYTEKPYEDVEKQLVKESDDLDQRYYQIDNSKASFSRNGNDIVIKRRIEQSICANLERIVCEKTQEIKIYNPIQFIRNIRKTEQVFGNERSGR